MSAYTQSADTTTDMGQRMQRKRVRHRSRHGSRHCFDTTNVPSGPKDIAPQVYQSVTHAAPNAIRSAQPRAQLSLRQPEQTKASNKRLPEEDDAARRIRVFGGSADEARSTELCGPMLDVVLGLFGSVDYDD